MINKKIMKRFRELFWLALFFPILLILALPCQSAPSPAPGFPLTPYAHIMAATPSIELEPRWGPVHDINGININLPPGMKIGDDGNPDEISSLMNTMWGFQYNDEVGYNIMCAVSWPDTELVSQYKFQVQAHDGFGNARFSSGTRSFPYSKEDPGAGGTEPVIDRFFLFNMQNRMICLIDQYGNPGYEGSGGNPPYFLSSPPYHYYRYEGAPEHWNDVNFLHRSTPIYSFNFFISDYYTWLSAPGGNNGVYYRPPAGSDVDNCNVDERAYVWKCPAAGIIDWRPLARLLTPPNTCRIQHIYVIYNNFEIPVDAYAPATYTTHIYYTFMPE